MYAEIEAHPDYARFTPGTVFGYAGARSGYSWCTKENNAWVRQIWRQLYLGDVFDADLLVKQE